jgi:outer membrane protein OmpA-like peptidoglycan-associated protein
MKYVALITCALLVQLFMPHSFAQEQAAIDNNYYVVIGAFANPKNAVDFTDRSKKNKYPAKYALNQNRNLYYVYILESADRSEAVTLAVKLQKQSTYSDTWVYQGLLGDNPHVVKIQEAERHQILEEVKKEEPPAVEQNTEAKNAPVIPVDGSKPFIFRIRSLSTGELVAADVDIYDADINKGRKVVSYRGNDVVNVKPINKSGRLAVVCDAFGYRKLQIPVNFNEPVEGDGVSIEEGNIVLTFDLVRLKKGDKVVMYNVYFFKDAAIMRPESRYEVNALLDFMKENSKAKIQIHGHTNGNGAGKIISMGESKDFFAITADSKEGYGSAMKLSEERAKVIRDYLISQGIEPDRMQVKPWGGKKPIYDDDHPSAAANIRVEIEVMED